MMDEKTRLVISGQSDNPSSVGSENYGGIINSPGIQPDTQRSGICADLEKNWRQIRYGRERLLPVFICSVIAAIGACLNGFLLGYSAMTQLYQKNDFPDQFTEKNFALIGSSATVGALLGGPVAGLLADRFGRKASLIFSTIPLTIGWLVIALSVEQFYWPIPGKFMFIALVVGRFVSGFGSGWLSLVVPLYIVEISPASLKGLFGSFNQLSLTVGILLVYLLGTGLHYYIVALIVLASIVVFVCLLQLIPETPRWLVANGERLLANSILYKLRGPRADVVHEMETLEKAVASEDELTFVRRVLLLKHRAVFVPFVLSLFLMFFQQFSGVNVVIFYAGKVVQDAGMEPTPAALSADFGVGIIQVVATFVSVLLVDILGRRILLISGATLLTLSTGCLGLYFLLLHHCNNRPNCPVDHFYIVAIVCLAVFIIGFSIGWGPIPWVLMGELAPMQVRGLLCGIATAVNWSFAAIITSSFDKYEAAVHPWWAWWSFTVCIALSIPFVFFFLPETRGKDLQDIQEYFSLRYGSASNGHIQHHNYKESRSDTNS